MAEDDAAVISETFMCDSVQISEVDEDGNITYMIQSEYAPDAEVTVDKTEDGGTRFFIVEGDLENELVLAEDGKIFLDGREVIFSSGTSNPDYGITPRARWSMYSEEPIKGTAADYNVYSRTETGNIDCQEKIVDITITALKLILQVAIPAMAHFTELMLDTVAALIKSEAFVKGPDSSFITYEIDVYMYKEVIPLEEHRKHVGRYYYTNNYTGSYTTYTYYYANMFS